MSYLARLKRLDGDENFTHPPKTVLPKLTKAPSVSSVSSIPAPIEKITPSKNDDCFYLDLPVHRGAPTSLPTIAERETDDRRQCTQCMNLRGRACGIAKPERGALVVAIVGYRPQSDTPRRCAGYLPNATDNDQQPGHERWSGLIQKGNE